MAPILTLKIFMRFYILFLISPALVFSQLIKSEDLELVIDSSRIGKIAIAAISPKREYSNLYASNWSVGVKGGLSIHKSQFMFRPDSNPLTFNFSYRIGPTISLSGEYKNNTYLSQQLTFGYFQAGGSDKSNSSSGDSIEVLEYGMLLDYLFTSYNIRIQYPVGNIIPFAVIGLQYERLINFDEYFILSNNKVEHLNTFPFSELIKNNVSPIIGIGIGYKINKIELQFEFLPLFHLVPFFEHEVTSNTIGAKHTISGFVLNAGIKYDL